MKIGIITVHNGQNYGASLQAYALVKKLRNMGFDAYLVDYRTKKIEERLSSYRRKEKYNSFSNILKNLRSECSELLFDTSEYLKLVTERFEEFHQLILDVNSGEYHACDEMRILNKEYDAFICGSDQIWNLECTKEIVPAYFLNFVANNKLKIAYAPSIASATFDGNKEELTNLIGRLDSVSVREKSTIDSVKEYTDKEINNVVDPTLLLEVQDYRKIENNNMENVKEYIFFYQLEEDGFKMAKWCEKLSRQKKLSIIYIYKDKIREFKNGEYAYGITPSEFLTLIDNASYVVTNSFHATVFSIIFGKKFCTFPTKNSSSRMRDLLKNIGLEKRIWSEQFRLDEEIDYKKVQLKLIAFSEKSKQYLKEALD